MIKKVSTLSLILSFSTLLFAQNPVFNIAAGMPVAFDRNYAKEGYGDHSLTRERVNLFAEIPLNIGTTGNILILPGVSYFLFNETQESSGALGGGYWKKLTHNAISIQSRCIYQFFNEERSIGNWYIGGIFGVYLWSHTTGNSSWWRYQPPGQISGEEIFNESGKGFFHSVYVGATSGYRFKTTSESKLHASLEGSFYPLFVTVDDEKRSMAMITVVLGFGQKKATRTNE